MPQSKSFWEHPITTIEEALSIRKQISALQEKLSSLFGSDEDEATKGTSSTRKGRRKMSAATIARMRAAQQARWAKKKGRSAGPLTAVAVKSEGKPAASKKRRTMSLESRAKIAAAAKRRWAKKK